MRLLKKYLGFPAFSSRRTKVLLAVSCGIIWPADIAALIVGEDGPGIGWLAAAILTGLGFLAATTVSHALEFRAWLKEQK
jgi:hypothetical protein